MLNLSEDDFWTELPLEVKQATNDAKAKLDPGEGIAHAQVMEEMKTHFLNR